MRLKYALVALFVLLFALIPLVPTRVSGQSGVLSRITQPIDNTRLTSLPGNVHPMARAEFDRGAAPASLPMDHMLLVLTRSAGEQAALETLLAQQQNRSSPNYHKWLTPEEFGQQFGPSDQDVQKITAWLESQGFQVNGVAKGRTTIDFSGNAGQVQVAFHAAIHSYVFANGEQHWSNSSDPQIPAALAPVVAGVNSLNNFPRKPMSRSLGVFRRSKTDGKVRAVHPNFTFPSTNCGNTNANCYALGPADFATIYNVPATINGNAAGTGETIAIVSDSDINPSDLTNFRSLFGLPAANFQQIETGADPGVLPAGDEVEADLDVQWAGAVAPGAQIDLVVSPSTNTAFGGDTSAQYIVNNNLAPILGYSYGECELELGTSGNAFYQGLWTQAATQGITVLVSTGDNGSAGCDPLDTSQTVDNPAQLGLAVNGVSSTPYNIAVGGTDFNDFTTAQASTYFNSSNTAAQGSAKGYIPEIAYNDSCTNSLLYTALGFTTAEAACNNATVANDGLIFPAGGSGGVSNCTTSTTTSTTIGAVSSCSGGYTKPSWQTGSGVPNDGKRDVPDLSLFSGDGTIQNFYIICEADADPDGSGLPCNLNSPYEEFSGVGGTSVAAEAFAGVMALIDQKTGSRQGLANPTFYALAAGQSASSCNSTNSPASTCIFYDVTSGTIAMPCLKGSPNCTVNFTGDANGVLSGYSAGTGYDLATGLGSANIGNLVNNFAPSFYLSSPSPVVTVSSPGASGTMSIMAVAVSGYTGTVNLACSGLPAGVSCSFGPTSVVFTAGTASVPVTVTVNTTSASWVAPILRPWGIGRSTGGEITLTLGLFLTVLLMSRHRQQLRSSTALAVVTLAVLVGVAACGGGSSSSSGSGSGSGSTTGPTGNTTATLTGTASSGTPVSSMTFTVTIQ